MCAHTHTCVSLSYNRDFLKYLLRLGSLLIFRSEALLVNWPDCVPGWDCWLPSLRRNCSLSVSISLFSWAVQIRIPFYSPFGGKGAVEASGGFHFCGCRVLSSFPVLRKWTALLVAFSCASCSSQHLFHVTLLSGLRWLAEMIHRLTPSYASF
jgi:hypothetical protein